MFTAFFGIVLQAWLCTNAYSLQVYAAEYPEHKRIAPTTTSVKYTMDYDKYLSAVSGSETKVGS